MQHQHETPALCRLRAACNAGSTPVSEIIPKHNLHLQSTVHTDELFDKHFGPHPRNEPAHAPRLMQKKYLQELQQKMPDVFEQTSASPVRCAAVGGLVNIAGWSVGSCGWPNLLSGV